MEASSDLLKLFIMFKNLELGNVNYFVDDKKVDY